MKWIVFLAALCTAPVAALADTYRGHIYDGDTIGPTFRLTIDGDVSFDTPETSARHGAQCPREIALGRAATQRLREMLDGAATIEMMPLIDSRGVILTADDGRGLMRLFVDGENVGHTLARDGLAVLYRWRTESVDWCAASPTVTPQ